MPATSPQGPRQSAPRRKPVPTSHPSPYTQTLPYSPRFYPTPNTQPVLSSASADPIRSRRQNKPWWQYSWWDVFAPYSAREYHDKNKRGGVAGDAIQPAQDLHPPYQAPFRSRFVSAMPDYRSYFRPNRPLSAGTATVDEDYKAGVYREEERERRTTRTNSSWSSWLSYPLRACATVCGVLLRILLLAVVVVNLAIVSVLVNRFVVLTNTAAFATAGATSFAFQIPGTLIFSIVVAAVTTAWVVFSFCCISCLPLLVAIADAISAVAWFAATIVLGNALNQTLQLSCTDVVAVTVRALLVGGGGIGFSPFAGGPFGGGAGLGVSSILPTIAVVGGFGGSGGGLFGGGAGTIADRVFNACVILKTLFSFHVLAIILFFVTSLTAACASSAKSRSRRTTTTNHRTSRRSRYDDRPPPPKIVQAGPPQPPLPSATPIYAPPHPQPYYPPPPPGPPQQQYFEGQANYGAREVVSDNDGVGGREDGRRRRQRREREGIHRTRERLLDRDRDRVDAALERERERALALEKALIQARHKRSYRDRARARSRSRGLSDPEVTRRVERDVDSDATLTGSGSSTSSLSPFLRGRQAEKMRYGGGKMGSAGTTTTKIAQQNNYYTTPAAGRDLAGANKDTETATRLTDQGPVPQAPGGGRYAPDPRLPRRNVEIVV
ncbi:hypothetical protein PYCC9005_004035 [Savitreella phatthalungensis]